MTASSKTDDAGTSVKAYEELRNMVLSGSPSDRHFEVALLLRQGVAGWIAGRSPCAAPGLAAPEPLAAVALPSNPLHADVVRVLANMALAGRQEMYA